MRTATLLIAMELSRSRLHLTGPVNIVAKPQWYAKEDAAVAIVDIGPLNFRIR
jgi:hypothetical protein